MSDSLGFRAETALAMLLNRQDRESLYGPVTAGLAERGVDQATYPVLSGGSADAAAAWLRWWHWSAP